MAKNDNKDAQASTQEQQAPVVHTDEVAAAPHPDAAYYVLQPTSAEIPPAMGNVPEGRFMEEVHKDADEAKSSAVEAHPAENQPVFGVKAEDK